MVGNADADGGVVIVVKMLEIRIFGQNDGEFAWHEAVD